MDDYPKCQCTWKKGKPAGILCEKPARYFVRFLNGIRKEAYTCSEHLVIYERNTKILTTECAHVAWRNRQRQNDAGQS